MYGYIYKTTDLFTNLIYIGLHHADQFEGLKYIGSGLIVTNIKNKCLAEGIDLSIRFKVELLDTAESKEELNEKEIYYIDKFNSRDPKIGYNMRKGGDCGPGGPMMKGKHHSEETKLKMSESRKGANNSNFGNHWHASDELKQLHSQLSSGEGNGMFGKTHSKETKLKIGDANRNRLVGYKFMNNGEKAIMVNPNDFEKYLSDGYVFGRLNKPWNIK